MTYTTEDGGRLNLYAKEPPMTFDEKYTVNHNEKAEKLNGRLAMLGVMAALGAYAVTGIEFEHDGALFAGCDGRGLFTSNHRTPTAGHDL